MSRAANTPAAAATLPATARSRIFALTQNASAFGLRMLDDSMYPSIRRDWVVVVGAEKSVGPGDIVAIELYSGGYVVRDLVSEDAEKVVVEAVNSGARQTFMRSDVQCMLASHMIIPPSRWQASPVWRQS